jgi:hypothetical protein
LVVHITTGRRTRTWLGVRSATLEKEQAYLGLFAHIIWSRLVLYVVSADALLLAEGGLLLVL